MPCGDVSGGVYVSVEGDGAGAAGEDRLALAVLRRRMPTRRAPLRGVGRGDLLDPAGGLVFQAPGQQAPAGSHDLSVQPGFLPDVTSGFSLRALCRTGHAGDP